MKRAALAVLVLALLLGAFVAFADLSARAAADGARAALLQLSPAGVGLALLLYLASYLGRSLRLAALLTGPAPVLQLLSITARHNLLNLLLPARTGEASLPVLLRAEAGRSLAEGTGALIVARVLDLGAVAAWLVTGLLLRGAAEGSDLGPAAGAALVVLLAGLGLLRPVAARLAAALASRRGRAATFLSAAASEVARPTTPRLLQAGLCSLATWLCTYGACFALLADMGGAGHPVTEALAGVDFAASLVGSTALHFVSILPLNTVAGVGPWEAGWTAGYVAVGLDESAALASALVSHAAILGFACLLGALGWFLRGTPAPGAAPGAARSDAPADARAAGMESRRPPA